MKDIDKDFIISSSIDEKSLKRGVIKIIMYLLQQLVFYSSIIIVLLAIILIIKNLFTEFGISQTCTLAKEKLITDHPMKCNKIAFQSYLKIVLLVLFSRFFIFLLGFIYTYYIKGDTLNLNNIWNRWDSNHYMYIAKNGYGNTGDWKFFIVFYPLYPILIKLFSFIFVDYFISGIFVSNLMLIIGSIYLYKLCLLDFNKKIAYYSIKYMLIYPVSFFYGIVYTESTFLALSIMFFYYLRKKRFLLASIIGMFCTLTKNQGLFLIIPALVEVIIALNINEYIQNKKYFKLVTKFIKSSLYFILLPIGFFIYLLINKIIYNDWFRYIKYQEDHWYHKFSLFPFELQDHVYQAFNLDDLPLRISSFIPQIFLFFFLSLSIIFLINKFRSSYNLFTLTNLVVIYSITWLISGTRYTCSIFTLFIILAIIGTKNKFLDFMITFPSILMLCFYSISYINHGVY